MEGEEVNQEEEETNEAEDFKVFRPLLKKIQNLVKKFSTSVLAKEELAKHSRLTVVKDCPTRWWTKLDQIMRMQEIYKENRMAIRNVCKAREWKQEIDLNDEDLILLDLFVDFFEDFRSKSDTLGGQKLSNIHLTFVYTKDLQHHIESYFEHEVLGNFSRRFYHIFTKQFQFILKPDSPDFQPIFVATSLLSPLYFNCLTTEEQNEGFTYLLEQLRRIEGPVRPKVIVPNEKKNIDFPGVKHLMLHASNQLVCKDDLLEKTFQKDKEVLIIEASKKLQEVQVASELSKQILMKEDPVDYWNLNKDKYVSKLPVLARNILAICPSSVSSERMFSVASLLSGGIS